MKTLIDKTTSAVAAVVLFAAACAMVGLGFALAGALAVFALISVGIAILAAPFAKLAQRPADDLADAKTTA